MDIQKLFSKGLKEIVTERLILSPLEEDDYSDLEELYKDPSATTFDSGSFSLSASTSLTGSLGAQISLWIQGSFSRQVLVLGIRLKGNKKLIGYRLLRIFQFGSIYTEIKLNKNFRGKGFAIEASQAIFGILLKYGATQIFTTVHRDNKSAVKLDLKLNLKPIEPGQYPLDQNLPPGELEHLENLLEFYPPTKRIVFSFFEISKEAYSLFTKARIYRIEGNLSKSNEVFERALSLEPNYIYSLDGAGWNAFDLKLFDLADNYFDRALSINKYFARSVLGKAYIKADLGKIFEAIDLLMRYMELEPDDDETMAYLGTLFYKVNYLPEALMCFEKALKINPLNHDAKQNIQFLKSRLN